MVEIVKFLFFLSDAVLLVAFLIAMFFAILWGILWAVDYIKEMISDDEF